MMAKAKNYVNEFFSLSLDAASRLQHLVPEFGYDGYGELVFYRTYSRIKHNGGQENWADVVTRVINGTFSIRKDWYSRNWIAWNEEYWQAYAEQMAISLFNMEWMPGGRGLWAMGTPFIYERGSMALNNCFAGETEFINNGQLSMLMNCVGKTVEVTTAQGQKLATVQAFGTQKLYTYVFKPAAGNSKYKLKYTATNNHRWILADGSDTTYLRAGDRVKVTPGKITTEGKDYEAGLVHGMIFADGCNFYNDNYYIQLCGWKEKLRPTIEKSEWYSHTIKTEDRMILTTKKSLKNLPTDESVEYKQGFLDGWKLFDGHAKNKSYCLDTIDTDAVQWVSDHSGILNYVMVGHSVESGPRTKPLNRIKLRFEPIEFIVDCRLDSGRTEEVYCVVEPDTHTFQLASGVITANCGFTILGGNDTLANDANWMMDALMLGVGVGFEPTRNHLKRYKPVGTYVYEIQDTREDWAQSVKLLLEAYTKPNTRKPIFKYDKLRAEGMPIKGFGGKASGPAPLIRLHECIEMLFELEDIDEVRLKADLGNMLGVCVVAGNVRRSAELMKGNPHDLVFMNLKDYNQHPERQDWGWMSNNTAALEQPRDFEQLGEVAKRVVTRGEPGIMNLRNFPYGRVGKSMKGMRKDKARGLNPCGEVPLEDKELCNVAETLPTRCKTTKRWYTATEYATMYCSSVSLLPTHREETNRIVARNRRIAVGIVDWTGWVQEESLHKVTKYMRKGYARVTKTNKKANAEAGVPEAIRKTTIKPGGTTPKLAGRTPGIGYPTFDYTLRRTRVARNHPMCPILDMAGVRSEPDVTDPKGTLIYEYPTLQGPTPPADTISLWEQAVNLATVQREWSDNSVSNTLYFRPKWVLVTDCKKPDEFRSVLRTQCSGSWGEDINWDDIAANRINTECGSVKVAFKENWWTKKLEMRVYSFDPNHEEDIIEKVLAAFAPLIKACSLLPHEAKGVYEQMPEEGITKDEYETRLSEIKRIDWSTFGGSDGEDEKFCGAESCKVEF